MKITLVCSRIQTCLKVLIKKENQTKTKTDPIINAVRNDILAFVNNFTTYVEGVGHVCRLTSKTTSLFLLCSHAFQCSLGEQLCYPRPTGLKFFKHRCP